MNRESFQPLEGCAAIQWQLSELADGGGEIPAEVKEHLESCEECAQFARLWVDGAGEPIEELKAELEPVSPALRGRILGDVNVSVSAKVIHGVPFRAGRTALYGMLSRIAAVAAIAAFSFWLLKPDLARRRKPAASRIESKVLAQTVDAMKKPMTHEQEALRQAAVAGGVELRDTIRDSLVIFQ